jgi:Zn-dependent M16 (insulinase) family peptidase
MFFFYGDDDPEERLRIVDAYVRDFDRRETDSRIPLQGPLPEPRQLTYAYDAGEDSAGAKKALLTVNWLLPEGDDPELVLGLNVLEQALVGMPGAPLRKALLDSGLGEELAGVGLYDGARQPYFSTGLRGMDGADAGKAEALILDTLAGLAREGIDRDTVTAAMNTEEFRRRENNTGRFPRGLLLMMHTLTGWTHDHDPLAVLAFEEPLGAIRKRLESGERYFEQLIEAHLVRNTHRTTVLLKPDPDFGRHLAEAEQARLADARAGMTDEDVQRVVEETRTLKQLQETPDTPEALATIPVLTLNDLDRTEKEIPLEELEAAGSRVLYHELTTNGLVYLDLGLDLSLLPGDLLPYVPMFADALTQMGTAEEDYVRLSQRIGRDTGGISADPFAAAVKDQDRAAAWLFVRGKSTVPKADRLLAILRDILLEVRLDDRDRFRQLVLEAKAQSEAMLIPNGTGVIHTRLGAQFGEAGWVAEQTGGVSQLFWLRRLAEAVERDWPSVLDKLEAVRRTLVNRSAMVANVTVDGESWSQIRPGLESMLAELPAAAAERPRWTPEPPPPFEGLTVPAQVNYVGKGANLYELGYELDGSNAVIQNYVRNTWLWERVRMKGGAYGVVCTFDRHSGAFRFLSYRDPNLLGTLETYDETASFLRELSLPEEERVKSIIGAIGQIDQYLLPDAKGYTSMVRTLTGVTLEDRQQSRDEVLSTTAADFRAFADVLAELAENGLVTVMGSPDAIARANAERGGWLEVTKVL